MDIEIYTDLKNRESIFMDFSSLIHTYEYAIREKNDEVASSVLSLFREETETVRISKKSPIYSFLKTIPHVKEDEITWKAMKEAYLIARLQNNTFMLRTIGKVLGHWEHYALENKEQDGLLKEVSELPEQVRQFIIKYHDVSIYELQKKAQAKKQEKSACDETNEMVSNRSMVEIGYDKIYTKLNQ